MNCSVISNFLSYFNPVSNQHAIKRLWNDNKTSLIKKVIICAASIFAGLCTFGIGGMAIFRYLVNRYSPTLLEKTKKTTSGPTESFAHPISNRAFELLQLANEGNVTAQRQVADFYWKGENGYPKNPKEAVKWYIKAAEQGDTDAQAALDRLSPQEVEEAEQGNVDQLRFQELGTEENEKKFHRLINLYLRTVQITDGCGYRGQESLDKAYKSLEDFIQKHPEFSSRVPKKIKCREDGNYGFSVGQIKILSTLSKNRPT